MRLHRGSPDWPLAANKMSARELREIRVYSAAVHGQGVYEGMVEWADGGLWFRGPAPLREILDWLDMKFIRSCAGIPPPEDAADGAPRIGPGI